MLPNLNIWNLRITNVIIISIIIIISSTIIIIIVIINIIIIMCGKFFKSDTFSSVTHFSKCDPYFQL